MGAGGGVPSQDKYNSLVVILDNSLVVIMGNTMHCRLMNTF